MSGKLVCPKCKSENSYYTNCLTSNPPQYEFVCSCGYELKYYARKNSYALITQQELDDNYKGKTAKEVVIKIKEIPESCHVCPCSERDEETYCKLGCGTNEMAGGRLKNCPIKEVSLDLVLERLNKCVKDENGQPLVCYKCAHSAAYMQYYKEDKVVEGTDFPGMPSGERPCFFCIRNPEREEWLKKNNLDVWYDGSKPIKVPMDCYHSTDMLLQVDTWIAEKQKQNNPPVFDSADEHLRYMPQIIKGNETISITNKIFKTPREARLYAADAGYDINKVFISIIFVS